MYIHGTLATGEAFEADMDTEPWIGQRTKDGKFIKGIRSNDGKFILSHSRVGKFTTSFIPARTWKRCCDWGNPVECPRSGRRKKFEVTYKLYSYVLILVLKFANFA